VAHAPAARSRPAAALPALRRAVEESLALEGTRGEAAEAARALRTFLGARSRTGGPR
jgi:hypothetical protein